MSDEFYLNVLELREKCNGFIDSVGVSIFLKVNGDVVVFGINLDVLFSIAFKLKIRKIILK